MPQIPTAAQLAALAQGRIQHGFKKGNPIGRKFQKGHTFGFKKGHKPTNGFKKGQLAKNWNGFKKGHKPLHPFPKGVIPATAFKKGHKSAHGFKKGHTFRNPGTHGLSYHPLYQMGNSMLNRCYNPKYGSYKEYGAIGILIWEPWKNIATLIHGIEALIGTRPIGYTIDRINPWEGYYEWNVRWATPKTQANNRRENTPDFYSQAGEH
jgi:hypothetical protein